MSNELINATKANPLKTGITCMRINGEEETRSFAQIMTDANEIIEKLEALAETYQQEKLLAESGDPEAAH